MSGERGEIVCPEAAVVKPRLVLHRTHEAPGATANHICGLFHNWRLDVKGAAVLHAIGQFGKSVYESPLIASTREQRRPLVERPWNQAKRLGGRRHGHLRAAQHLPRSGAITARHDDMPVTRGRRTHSGVDFGCHPLPTQRGLQLANRPGRRCSRGDFIPRVQNDGYALGRAHQIGHRGDAGSRAGMFQKATTIHVFSLVYEAVRLGRASRKMRPRRLCEHSTASSVPRLCW